MNLKTTIASLGLIAGTTFGVAAIPAQAASLVPGDLGLETLDASEPITDGQTDLLTNFPYTTSTFTPDRKLRVKFSILQPEDLGSRGKNLSSFGYFVGSSFVSIFEEDTPYDAGSTAKKNDWYGSCSNAILEPCEVTVVFQKGVTYQLGLRDTTTGDTFYGVAALDELTFNARSDQFYPNPGGFETVSEDGALFIGLEDGGYRQSNSGTPGDPADDIYYYDYQDWVVKAKAVPEPATLAGLGVVTGGLVLARRRRKATETA